MSPQVIAEVFLSHAGSRSRRESYSVSEATTAAASRGLLHTDPRFVEQEVRGVHHRALFRARNCLL